MAETDINSYRFGRNEEPTDEMLQQIMSEVTATAIEKYQKAHDEYFAHLRELTEQTKAKWAEQIKALSNA